jgi:hypothetical protein
MILDYLWQYPPYITLLIMLDLVSVSYPQGLLVSIHSDVNEAARRTVVHNPISLYRPIPIFRPQFALTHSLNFDTFYLTNLSF